MTYDPATKQTVLFGGLVTGSDGTLLGDTWIWSGSNWTNVHPLNSPSPRFGSLLAYDGATGNLVLYGGESGFGPPFVAQSDTWMWDGSTWHQENPATSPSPRSGASMSFDAASSQLIMFGGQVGNGVVNDTWLWNGSTWSQLQPSVSPPSRFDASMAYDGAGSQLVLFGGQQNGPGLLSDTWLWNGATWAQAVLGTVPPARSGGLMSGGGMLASDVLVGGNGAAGVLTDTWRWTGATWLALTTANSPLNGVGLSYDASSDQILFVDPNAVTYALGNGPSGPPGGCGPALASPTVGIAASEGGTGYWIADRSGQIAACGTAPQLSTPFTSNAPIVGIAAAPTGEGYWLVASDGGVFAFGNATYQVSMGGRALNAPIVGIAADPFSAGYWEAASDGGIFAFDASFRGSMGGRALNAPIVGIAAVPSTGGYWEVAADGHIFSFLAAYYGSAP